MIETVWEATKYFSGVYGRCHSGVVVSPRRWSARNHPWPWYRLCHCQSCSVSAASRWVIVVFWNIDITQLQCLKLMKLYLVVPTAIKAFGRFQIIQFCFRMWFLWIKTGTSRQPDFLPCILHLQLMRRSDRLQPSKKLDCLPPLYPDIMHMQGARLNFPGGLLDGIPTRSEWTYGVSMRKCNEILPM